MTRLSQTEEVARAHLRGLSHTRIAEALGVSYQTVCREIGIARAQKLIPPRKPPDPAVQITTKLKTLGLPKGNIGDMLSALSEDERDWMFDKAVRAEYETVAEYLTDLVRTAYDAETGDEG